MSNYKKHSILKALYNYWKEGEDKTISSFEVTPYGRSLTVIEIQKETSFGILKIEEICITLLNDYYIERLVEDKENKSHRYLITDLGKSAFIDRYFLHKRLFFSFDFWKWVLTFLVGLIGLLNSIYHWVDK